jgi:acetolactate synthase-1/3 small subunit
MHTLSVLLENKPGALARVSGAFTRRGYNIESLAVGPTERSEVSRITLRVDCAQGSLDQIAKQLHKLVNVLRVTELRSEECVERELALVSVNAPPARRAELMSLAEVFPTRIADVGPETMTFEVVGTPDQIEQFEELVRPFGLKEVARTGRIALGRSLAHRARRRPVLT